MAIKNLQHIMESFFLCSHLPIYAVDSTGNLILCTGLSPQLSSFIKEDVHSQTSSFSEEVCKLLKANQTQLLNEGHFVYTPKEHLHFSLCPIDPHDLSSGTYIIGPYTSSLNLRDEHLFKPPHCMPPLIQLLYSFGESSPAVPKLAQSEYSYHMNKAKAYIDQHYKEIITLDTLAQHLNLNKSYVCTLFRKGLNDSFCNYTNRVRVEKSKQLLTETTDSILEIGLNVGFSSGSYYHTIFKKFAGLTPLEYRSQHSN